jgi:hypothetical protein
MEKPFRLLDLPAEIRDQIYHDIVCTWPAYKSTWDEEKQQAVVPTEVAVMNRKTETAILRANRQVYQEAKTVMLRGNQFIRVSMKGFQPLRFLFIPSQVPVVTMDQDIITKYKGFVMTHSIDITDDPAPLKGQFEVMILRRDLDRFAQALGKADMGSPNFTATSKHRVTVHNPFVGTLTPNFLDSKNQVSTHTRTSTKTKYERHFLQTINYLGTSTCTIPETSQWIQKLHNRRQGQSRDSKRGIHRGPAGAHSRSSKASRRYRAPERSR